MQPITPVPPNNSRKILPGSIPLTLKDKLLSPDAYGISNPLPNIGLLRNLFFATSITSSLEENASVNEFEFCVPLKKNAPISSFMGVIYITNILKVITEIKIIRLYLFPHTIK